MKFSIFQSVNASQGSICTSELFWSKADDKDLAELCAEIAKEENPHKRGEMKKKLPIITWQAYFEGKRLIKNAEPSGLFMLDIDHMEEDP